MFRTRWLAVSCLVGLTIALPPISAQIPLSPLLDAGNTITPAYEGWYPNPDGTLTLSFGYYSRNKEEVVDIPVGPNNFLSPGPENQGQPTTFHPLRHWGVFTVRVPADFGDRKLTWTLVNRGETYEIPGHTQADWLLDAKLNPASDNTPPSIRLEEKGGVGNGPDGITVGPVSAKVAQPLELSAWVTDDEIGRNSTFLRQTDPIVLHWFKHQGPGPVEFADAQPKVDKEAGGYTTTSATFSTPGDYVLRLRANDYSGVTSGGHAQCCWSNGFVRVTVTE